MALIPVIVQHVDSTNHIWWGEEQVDETLVVDGVYTGDVILKDKV